MFVALGVSQYTLKCGLGKLGGDHNYFTILLGRFLYECLGRGMSLIVSLLFLSSSEVQSP